MNHRHPQELLLEALDNRLMHHAPAFAAFLSEALPGTEVKTLEVRDCGALTGILRVAIRHDPTFGTVVNSLPFFGSHGGPMAAHRTARLALLHEFRALVESLDAASATLIEDPFTPLDAELIAATGLEVVDDRIGQFTRLPATMDALHVKTRNAIRKGQRLDQRIERRDDAAAWAWMQGVHERSIRGLGGVPKALAVFEALRSAFGADAQLWVGAVGGAPVSGVVVIRYRGTVEYFTPVVEEAHRDSQALSATIFEVMQRSAEDGATLWNWGGTWRSQEGVYRFKSRWGAEDLPYRYLNGVRAPALRAAPRGALAAAFPHCYLFRY